MNEPTGTSAVDAASTPQPAARSRRLLASVFWLLASIAILFSGLTLWAHQTLLTSNGWGGIVEDVIAEPEVVEEISSDLVRAMSARLEVRDRVADAVPGGLDIVAGAITAAVEERITDAVISFASSEGFQDGFVAVNRAAHDAAITAIRGSEGGALTSEQGVLTLNLFPLVEGVLRSLQDEGLIDAGREIPDLTGFEPTARAVAVLETALGRELSGDFGIITLVDSEDLALLQDIVRWFDLITALAVLAAVLFVALALWLSRPRVRMVLWLAGGAIAALAAGRLIARLLFDRITERAQEGDASVTVMRTIEVAVDSLMWFTFVLMALALATGVVAWWWERRGTGQRPAMATPPRTLGAWVRENSRTVLLAGLGVIAFLVLWNVGGPDIALVTAAGVGLLLVGISILSEHEGEAAPAGEAE